MKATYQWIRELVPEYSGDVVEMCRAFTMSGTEVEWWAPCGDDDWVIEFAVTSNRVDCNGVLGLARELAAVAGLDVVLPDTSVLEDDTDVNTLAAVTVEDTAACPRGEARVLRGARVGPSPDWLVSRIEAIGLRSVNNVVDVTNYVMFESNQPFHAFDLPKIAGARLIARKARAGETLTAINGKDYELTVDDLVIADEKGPVGIAGVMGGLATEVGDATTDILLETACFEPLGVRATARRLNLHSDASFRFERGVDGFQTEWASRRCAHLMAKVAGGTFAKGVIDVNHLVDERPTICFRPEQVKRITGIEIPFGRCREIFEGLEIEVTGTPPGTVTAKPPTWRGDLTREIDLVEEVIRVHGLEDIPLETSMRVALVLDSHGARVRDVVKRTLVASGFLESLTTSFLAEEEARMCLFASTEPILIRNAMRKDENALRQSLVPSMLGLRKTNQDRFNQNVRLAECSVVYINEKPGEIPRHLPLVSGILDGDFRSARGVVEALAEALRIEGLEFAEPPGDHGDWLDAEASAQVTLSGGAVLGFVGVPAQGLLDRHELKVRPLVFELRLDLLEQAACLDPHYEPVSKFPPVKRDLAVIVDDGLPWGRIESVIQELNLPDLEAVEFFDEYRGRQIAKGKKSLAFSLAYRAFDRTLTNEDVDASQARLISALEQECGAEVRDSS